MRTVSGPKRTERAILIDVGGVLRSDGLPAVAAAWSRRLGIPEQSLRCAVFAGSDAGVLVGRENEETWWQVVADRLGIGPDLLGSLADDITTAGTWDEQLLAYLRHLRGRARTAIVSNAWPHLRGKLTEERLDDVADEVILSCEVGYAKPNARILRLALGRLAVSAEKALLIDDTRANVAAALSAGLAGHLHTTRAGTTAAIERFLGEHRCP